MRWHCHLLCRLVRRRNMYFTERATIRENHVLEVRAPFMTLICSHCGHEYSTAEPRWRCQCGGYFRLHKTGMFTKEQLALRPRNLWRYREALGIDDKTAAISLGEGWTPLEPARLNNRD